MNQEQVPITQEQIDAAMAEAKAHPIGMEAVLRGLNKNIGEHLEQNPDHPLWRKKSGLVFDGSEP